ncbi:MAG: ribonuclease III [bacterium]
MSGFSDEPRQDAGTAPGQSTRERLQARIGYRFRDPSLLEEALTHRSLLNELNQCGRRDNERLEFLGDAVLGLVTADMLMQAFPDATEGELTPHRASLVRRKKLAEIAEGLELGGCLYLGRGEEQTAGRQKSSLLADALEALIGAVYLDGGFDAASKIVQEQLSRYVEEARGQKRVELDPKTRVQELLLALYRLPPVYEVVEEQGPEHAKTFTVRLLLRNHPLAVGHGRNKKEAEQDAAGRFLAHLALNPLGMR